MIGVSNKVTSLFVKLFSGKFLVLVLGFVNTIILANGIDAEGIGHYFFIIATSMLLMLFIDWGGHSYYFKRLIKVKESKAYTVSMATYNVSKVIASVLISMLLLALVALSFLSAVDAIFIILLSTTFAFQHSIFTILKVQGKFKAAQNSYELIPTLARSVMFLGGFLMLDEPTVLHALLAHLMSTLISILIYFQMFSRFDGTTISLPKATHRIKANISRLTPLALVNIALYFHSQVDVIVLKFLNQPDDIIGQYGVAARVAQLFGVVYSILALVFPNKIAEYVNQVRLTELNSLLSKLTCFMIVLGLGQYVILYFTIDFILPIWGQDFIAAKPYVMLLCFAQLFMMAFSIYSHALFFLNHQKYNTILEIGGFLLNLLLSIFMISILGPVGGALATCVSMCLLNTLRFVFYKKAVNERHKVKPV
ncbi:hypothetical protein A7985_17310 [Pseudoalteromonas luteoviolacea]|uniref:Uncharacterized protein n=1 Tax=Pseudoalteromonas luteoviolacea TaxID=43657 RepID=A0A1C0TMW7_9GAMM|nr:polysaccharide biosynthesis C-terminal domain-containing protein [Pseudoalteromonas luteoviolacea]OCQ20189.1 hypothetical protein A7985_17310 [Pseudoalteromonas luteoviolacea]